MTFVSLLKNCAQALLGASLALSFAAPAGAQVISNTATAQWNHAGTTQSINSNRVDTDVSSFQLALTIFTPLPGSSTVENLRSDYCSNNGSQNGSSFESARGISTPVAETNILRIGQDLVLRVDAPAANISGSDIDIVDIEITTQQGDLELLTGYESLNDSGIFLAKIPTRSSPPAITQLDCALSLIPDETISATVSPAGQNDTVLAYANVKALADPFGIVFDSFDGTAINGARITLIDTATGAPANVYSFDGVTPWPSTLISGETVIDGAGNSHSFATGRFQFPLVALGTYQYRIEAPSPYSAPSTATPAQIAQLIRPGGDSFVINDASYLRAFDVMSLVPFEADIPLDSPAGLVTISKSSSLVSALPGDVIFYDVTLSNTDQARSSEALTLNDAASNSLRMKPDSIRVNGQPTSGSTLALNGHGFDLSLPSIPAGEELTVRYAMSVREDATPGFALNIATATPTSGNGIKDQTQVEILRDTLAGKMTIIGRVTENQCENPQDALGIPGVRIMLEDGSYAITDETGRYNFEGINPGTHVVHAASQTLPEGGDFVDCARSTRNAGSAISTLVRGQGGSLHRADFYASVPKTEAVPNEEEAAPRFASDQENAGADTDWFALGNGPPDFLFPTLEHNPRTPSIRVVIRHGVDETAKLSVDGEAVDNLAYEGSELSPDKSWRVSIWRGIRLNGTDTQLQATILTNDGSKGAQLERTVRFADTPMFAQIVEERSHLLADGRSKPIVAVRLTDRRGTPIHAGVSGSFSLEGNYQTASEIENRNSRKLTGFGQTSSNWLVEGDDGIAYIELAPTMISGALRLNFNFSDGTTVREEMLETWIEPGNPSWTVIGIAEGTAGSKSVADLMEYGAGFDSDLGDNARVALYAKGRILGKLLATLSYDSAKPKAEQRLGGVIDPSAYYTIFGDGSERLYDAASREKLYVRIESRAFYALYGDFETGFDQTELARYQRSATGIQTQARLGQVQLSGFAAEIGTLHRRDEIQGSGVTGPYSLSSRRIVPNSETVTLEVRDRLRSEKIISRQELIRFADYTIDILTGTIRFIRPLQSRDQFLNPQFAVVNYEVDEFGDGQINAGLRANWTSKNGKVKIGASAVSDKGEGSRSNLGAIDVRLRIADNSELRAEAAISEKDGTLSQAYSLEVEHHTGKLDLLAYAKQIDRNFGVGQQNLAERGRRKVGADARYNFSNNLAIEASGWLDQSLVDSSERRATDARVTWLNETRDVFVGIAHLDDTLADGTKHSSNLVQAGATQRFLGNRLEVSAATSIELSGSQTIDLPARHNFSARYKVSPLVNVIGAYEIATGASHKSTALTGGIELTPWAGATASTTIGTESLGADSARTFAAFSLGQSIPLTSTLTVDGNIDTNRTIGGSISIDEVISAAHPAGNGGHLSRNGQLGEDFTAGGLGFSWSHDLWSARLRTEYRDGEFANLAGVSAAAIRQLGEGSVVGAGGSWTRTDSLGGSSSEIIDASLSAAHRPANSAFAFLGKLEFRSDNVSGAVAGETGGLGRSVFELSGDAQSRRLIISATSNWSPKKNGSSGRQQVSIFAAARRNFDQYEGQDYSGTTLIAGVDSYFAIGEKFNIGARATVRSNLNDDTTSFAFGPEIGFSPVEGTTISVGYNITGFRDEDFSKSRTTEKGVFASVRFKFDESLFSKLGL